MRVILRVSKSLSLPAHYGSEGVPAVEINGRNPLTNLDISEPMRLEASKGAEEARQGPCETAVYHP